MDNIFEKAPRAGLHAHTMQGYLCGHYIMIRNNAGVAANRLAARRIPNPSGCDITDLVMVARPCNAEMCERGVDVWASTGRILQLMMEAEDHLGSAMVEYFEAMAFYLSIPLNVRARLEDVEGCAPAHKQFSHKAVDWQVDPVFADRRAAIRIICAAKSELDEVLDRETIQRVMASVYRALFLSFRMYAVNRRAFDSLREMVELQERLEMEADDALEAENRRRIKRFRMVKEQREGIKSRLRNARPETNDEAAARLWRVKAERRSIKMERQRYKDRKKRELQLASGRWMSRTDLNPRKLSLL